MTQFQQNKVCHRFYLFYFIIIFFPNHPSPSSEKWSPFKRKKCSYEEHILPFKSRPFFQNGLCAQEGKQEVIRIIPHVLKDGIFSKVSNLLKVPVGVESACFTWPVYIFSDWLLSCCLIDWFIRWSLDKSIDWLDKMPVYLTDRLIINHWCFVNFSAFWNKLYSLDCKSSASYILAFLTYLSAVILANNMIPFSTYHGWQCARLFNYESSYVFI